MTEPILLYWNFKTLKWQDSESFSPDGGETLGKQWFMPPAFFVHKGNNTFIHQRNIKFEYAQLVMETPNGEAVSQQEMWIGLKIEPPEVPLETDPNSQMPFVTGKDNTETFSAVFWFVPNMHPRFARGME